MTLPDYELSSAQNTEITHQTRCMLILAHSLVWMLVVLLLIAGLTGMAVSVLGQG